MQSALTRRFFALSFIGCLLLLVYQVVFMARTSAARDLNHIRNARLTIQQAERFVLHNVSEARIAATIAEVAHDGVGRAELLRQRVPKARARKLSHVVPAFYVRAAKADGHFLPLLRHSGLFRLAKPPHGQLSAGQVFVAHYDGRVPVDYVVDYAVARGFAGVVYVVPPDWAPKIGAREYAVPVAVSLRAPARAASIAFDVAASDDVAIERTVAGHISEAVVVGNSGESPESLAVFVEMTRVLDALATRGWKPYRTIRFVAFPAFSAAAWAHDERSWVRQHAVAYIDTSGASSISASPLLNRTMNWAVDTLRAGGLYAAEPAWLPGINPPDGANVFEFALQVPSVSAGLADAVSTTRMLNLVLMSIAVETVVPFVVSDYAAYLGSPEFRATAVAFDELVELLKFEFTHEYPWYQGVQKLRSVVQLKRASARLAAFERQLTDAAGAHVVFANDAAGMGTSIARDAAAVQAAVQRILDTAFLSI